MLGHLVGHSGFIYVSYAKVTSLKFALRRVSMERYASIEREVICQHGLRENWESKPPGGAKKYLESKLYCNFRYSPTFISLFRE